MPEPEDWEVEYNQMQNERHAAVEDHMPDEFYSKKQFYDETRAEAQKIVDEKKARAKQAAESGEPQDAVELEINDEQLRAHVFELEHEPAPRVTEADRTNDRKSLDRALSTDLYLIVKKDRGGDHEWQFPQGGYEDADGSLRATAERELSEELGSDLDAYYLSNAPSGMHAYAFPEEHRAKTGYFGAKVFLYRAIVKHGEIKLPEGGELTDYAWVTKDELKEYFAPDLLEVAEQVL
jgi:large subunit ribosomal protein L46